MTRTAVLPTPRLGPIPPPAESNGRLLATLLLLAGPVLAEHVLHIVVGVTDTYLANHLVPQAGLNGDALASARLTNAAAAAAVGGVTYVGWFMGLLTGAVGTGSTAVISRATGGGDRRTANRAVGQSILLAGGLGLIVAVFVFALSDRLPAAFGLATAQAETFLAAYFRYVAWGVPFAMVMFVANACLRGAGDTLTPALAMIVVDVVNVILSYGLCYGAFGLPRMGFEGIALGTLAAYVCGGSLQVLVLIHGRRVRRAGRSGVRLRLRRMRPDPAMIRRLLRIGLPSGTEGALHWGANFAVLYVVNSLGDVAAAAHVNAIRVESFSYMTGFAFATAAATMVGQSLGRGDAPRARRSARLAYAAGGGAMTLFGLSFILAGGTFAGWIASGPAVARLTAAALFVTGFCQCGFAAAMVFGGVMRGAGDTLAVMWINLASTFGVRLVGVLLAVYGFGLGLTAVWVVLASELALRGALLYARFASGRWEAAAA